MSKKLTPEESALIREAYKTGGKEAAKALRAELGKKQSAVPPSSTTREQQHKKKQEKQDQAVKERVPAGKTGNCPFYYGGTCNTQPTAPCSWNPNSYSDCNVYKLFGGGLTRTCPHCGAQLKKMDYSQLYRPGTRIVVAGVDNSCPSCGKNIG
jgi:hypothetical protein